ncbi:MAG: TonB-dependent receptor plug domain-containing protein, partial [Glaciecola sp.]
MNTKLSYLSLACLAAMNTNAMAEEEATEAAVERIQVVGKSVSYANNETTESMLKQQSNLTSVLAGIDNLPGVLINEGDTFGSDDWSTTVSIRGFQISLDEQQIGITVDGIANGNSNYGGGAKANRFIDTENLALIEVSQGTADIASRSNEALGGTLNFTTISPTEEENLLMSVSLGDFDARKYFVRYNTGEIARDTYAWVSVSSASNTDWVNQSAENRKDHIAAKLISDLNAEWGLSAYVSYDD